MRTLLFFTFLFLTFTTSCQVKSYNYYGESWTQEKVKIFNETGADFIQQSIKVECVFRDSSKISSLISVCISCQTKTDCSSYCVNILEPIKLFTNKEVWRFITDDDEMTVFRDQYGTLVILLHQLNGVNFEYRCNSKRI